jgi:hypothetical protein
VDTQDHLRDIGSARLGKHTRAILKEHAQLRSQAF